MRLSINVVVSQFGYLYLYAVIICEQMNPKSSKPNKIRIIFHLDNTER